MLRPACMASVTLLCFLGIVGPRMAALDAQTPPRGTAPAEREWTPARTVNGQIDIEGVWDFSTITPLERPANLGDKQTFSAEEAAAFERAENLRQNRDLIDYKKGGLNYLPGSVVPYNEFWYERGNTIVGSRRTSLIVDPPDGRIPALTPQARSRLEALDAEAREEQLGTVRADSAQSRSLVDRCIVGLNAGPPFVPGAYNNRVQIVQGPEHVVFVMEMIHEPRVVPLDGRAHVPATIRPYVGDSRGRWEGRTLVVNTTNFLRETSFRGSSASMRLEERFTRTGPDTLLYQFRVEDPDTWMRPWTVVVPLQKANEAVYEYACHEGNYAMRNILAGVRAQERAP
jgi:hypothetical protein